MLLASGSEAGPIEIDVLGDVIDEDEDIIRSIVLEPAEGPVAVRGGRHDGIVRGCDVSGPVPRVGVESVNRAATIPADELLEHRIPYEARRIAFCTVRSPEAAGEVNTPIDRLTTLRKPRSIAAKIPASGSMAPVIW